jgi:hypothetical protein
VPRPATVPELMGHPAYVHEIHEHQELPKSAIKPHYTVSLFGKAAKWRYVGSEVANVGYIVRFRDNTGTGLSSVVRILIFFF